MKKQFIIFLVILTTIVSCQKDNELEVIQYEPTVKLLFVANEGNYGDENG